MNIIISGAGGFMGREVAKLAEKNYQGMTAAAGVDPVADSKDFPFTCGKSFEALERDCPELVRSADVIIDFSNHAATEALTSFAVKNNLPLVLATTGQTEDELALIHKASEHIPLFFASNYSIGIALLVQLAKTAAAALPDAEVEIIEVHHDRKIDAPSGTALTLAKAIQDIRQGSKIVAGRSGLSKREPDDIGISSVRIGNVAGIHEVIIGTQNQTITLKHEAHSRALFAEGALTAAAFLKGKEPGLYNMESMMNA